MAVRFLTDRGAANRTADEDTQLLVAVRLRVEQLTSGSAAGGLTPAQRAELAGLSLCLF